MGGGMLLVRWLQRLPRRQTAYPCKEDIPVTVPDRIPHIVDLSVTPDVTAFFDEATNTVTYVVRDPASTACAVIDSVMDIDYAAGRISYGSADAVVAHITT